MNKIKTPKVFFSSYRPKKPQAENKGQFKRLFMVVLIIVGGYFFTRLPVFQIKNIDTTGVESTEVISELNSLMGSSILSANVANKVHEIQRAHIELINLHCDKGIPDTLRCRSDERKAVFNWRSSGKVYLIDKDGLAFIAKEIPNTPTIEDRENVKVSLGDQVISEEMATIYQDIINRLDKSSYIVKHLYIHTSPLHPGAVISGRKGGKPFTPTEIEVQFSAGYPIDVQVKLLSQLIETKAGLIKEGVDLRTPGYIYYK